MFIKKIIYVFFLIVLFIPILISQNDKWSGGVILGGTNYQGDLVESILFEANETKLAGGVFLRKKFNQNLSGKFSLLAGRISGDDANSTKPGRINRGFSFTTTLFEPSLTGELELPTGKFNPYIRPYLFLGVGATFFTSNVDFNEANISSVTLLNAVESDKRKNTENVTYSLPIGVGIRRDFNKKVYLGFEAGYRIMSSDYLDGISESGNEDRKDWWLSLCFHAGYRFQFIKDSDGDGVSDNHDKCPRHPGKKIDNGCPDSDGDRVVDNRDKCPDLPGPQDLKGCPDSDGDGIVDSKDSCPNFAGSKSLDGCPDSDGDGITDMEDQCPNAAGSRAMSGCPDSDNDGISDPNDNCPREKGTIENNGCPIKN